MVLPCSYVFPDVLCRSPPPLPCCMSVQCSWMDVSALLLLLLLLLLRSLRSLRSLHLSLTGILLLWPFLPLLPACLPVVLSVCLSVCLPCLCLSTLPYLPAYLVLGKQDPGSVGSSALRIGINITLWREGERERVSVLFVSLSPDGQCRSSKSVRSILWK